MFAEWSGSDDISISKHVLFSYRSRDDGGGKKLQNLPIPAVKNNKLFSMHIEFGPVFIIYIVVVIYPEYRSSTSPPWGVIEYTGSPNVSTESSFTWNGIFVLIRHKFDQAEVTVYTALVTPDIKKNKDKSCI